jgi:hypothetical protein
VYANLLQTLEQWLLDPLTGKLVLVLAGLTLIMVVTRQCGYQRPPRRTSLTITSSSTAPMVAAMIEATMPAPR